MEGAPAKYSAGNYRFFPDSGRTDRPRCGRPGRGADADGEKIIRSWQKPLGELTDREIGRLVGQHGFPYVLDLVWPKLEADPLFDGGYYPGDVLANLIRAGPEIWVDRPEYRARLDMLFQRALDRPEDENWSFRDSLHLPGSDAPVN